ncbi:ABC transporter permease [Paracoccus sp. PS-1]|uniref:ABC transporter permease n=1 Tax=unclassified Paracoccus (in: a-proteobacteria) TaxID=2688777 RepID=UPI000490C3E3|nr:MULTISPECIES: ABC transporter permease [unclassified Paracoccus (in: a-proteobacteria)]MDQ7261887.1 ABC transporter permease [Paracoccus sp. PS1]
MSFSPTRLRALLRKEFIQMRRDRVTFAMMLGVPIMQLLLFGYAINSDPRDMPAALVAPAQDRFGRSFAAALENSGYYRITHPAASAGEAERLITRGEVSFVVTVPADFGRRMQQGDRPQILVEADGSDPSATSGAIAALPRLADSAFRRDRPAEPVQGTPEIVAPRAPEIIVHRRYNPEGVTQYNIVPGLLGVILQMTMVMMTAMALTREIERGTMENLLAMPATPAEIMLGKITPFLAVGAVQVLVILGAAWAVFDVPFVGSLGLLLAGVMVFVLALVLLGYLISTVARTQMQAMQVAIFVFLPSVLLSGFMFPFRGMPGWAQALGEVLPVTHLLRLVRAVMLKGAGFADVAPQFAALAAMVAVLGLLALLRFRRTLD